MKKLYCLILIVFSVNCLYSQVTIEAVRTTSSRYQFVNKNTGIKVNDLSWDETESFVNGFAKVTLDHKWGFVDQSGNPVIKTIYNDVRNFVNKVAAVNKNSKWGFINEKGLMVIPAEYDIVYDFKETVTAVFKNKTWFLINRQGNVVKQLNVDVFWGFKNGFAKITRNGQSGIMNTKGEIISMEPSKNAPSLKKVKLSSSRTNTAPCPPNIDFEFGNLVNWWCDTGQVYVLNNAINVITVSPSLPINNRHTLITAANPSAIDPWGLFPINPPDGSNHAVRLGNDINGHQAERISYQFVVPTNDPDASITYRYAVVFQDPGHPTFQQPRFSAKLLDVQTNTYLPCATYEYVATSSLPGFNNSPINDSVKYKDWASVYINLARYAGKTLKLEFTTADCAPGAHWGYAYVDVGDCNITANVQYTCSPAQAIFTAPPGFQYYKWWSNNFSTLLGTGETMIMASPPAPGSTIFVEVIPYNGFGCADTLHVPYVAGFPTADAGPDKVGCAASPTTIGTAALAGTTYSWSPTTFLSNPNISNPVADPPVTTTYHVIATSTVSGCTAEDSVVITVNEKPVAGFTAPPSQCLNGNSFTFTNTSTISSGTLSYQWYFGDGASSTQTSPVHSYTNAGTYSVKLIATSSNGCKDSVTISTITVGADATANAGPDKAMCTATATAIGSTAVAGNTYSWTPATFLSNPAVAMPNANPPVTTTYHVIATNSASGCTAEDSVVVTVNAKPVPGFTAPPAQCLTGNSFNFTNTSTISSGSLTYQWYFGDGSTSSQTSPVHSYTNAGTYTVKLAATSNNGCKDSVSNSAITVNSNPAVKTNIDAAICRGNTVQLQTTGAQTYTWNAAPTLSCTNCSNPIASPLTNATYIVRGTDNFGCFAYDTVNITVHQPIDINASPDRSICRGDSVRLQTTGNAATYIWSPAQTLSGTTITNPLATPTTTTQYRVVGYDGHNCFNDTAYVTITVNPKPQIELGPDLVLSTGTVYTLNPVMQEGNIVSWQWTPPVNLDCPSCPTPAATIKNDISYRVLITNSAGCTATDSINIRSFCEGSQVFIPNAFTPDGDGKNDILMVRAKGIELVKSFRIFTRWGELIFEKNNFAPNDPAFGWDGKVKGVKGAAEVYVYTAEVICTNLQTYIFKGNTTILK